LGAAYDGSVGIGQLPLLEQECIGRGDLTDVVLTRRL